MKETEMSGISRRRLFEVAGISAGAALVAGLPAFARDARSGEATPPVTTQPVTPRIPAITGAAADDESIRPFHVSFPDADLVDLRRRVVATKWPERELVPDATQGVQLATMQKLAHYGATDYDWRKVEARLNALPQLFSEELRVSFRSLR